MSYQTGTASSPVNLLQTIATWLASIGWTQDANAADGVGWRVHMHKSGVYVNLRASMNDATWAFTASTGYALHMYLGTGYASGNVWNNQPGGPIVSGQTYQCGVAMALITSGAIQNYYFFGDATGDNVVIVVERSPALYLPFAWGQLQKIGGAWTGGPYFAGAMTSWNFNLTTANAGPGGSLTGSCPGADADIGGSSNLFVRADIDAFTSKWLCSSQNTNGAVAGYTGKFCLSSVCPVGVNYQMRTSSYAQYGTNQGSGVAANQWQGSQTSAVDGRANLLPVMIWATRDSGLYSPIGIIPNVFSSNGVGNGFANVSEYVLGSTTYKMFPNFAVVKQ